MLESIRKRKYKVLEFLPFVDYVKNFDNIEKVLIKEESKAYRNNSSCLKLIYKLNDEYIKILIYKDKEKEWASFYKYREERWNYEQIEFLLDTEGYRLEDGIEYNNVIKYSAHLDDENYSKIVNSTFTYKDNEYLCGWREKRKIDINDLPKVVLGMGMNLTELVMRAEKAFLDFYEAITLKEGEVPKLVLGYDE